MDFGNISQMLRDSKIQGNLRNHPLAGRLGLSGRSGSSGFMMTAADETPGIPPLGQGGGMDEFSSLVALAQAQAEMSLSTAPADRESARNLAQMRAMSLKNEMLQGLAGPEQGGQDRALELIRRMNAEAILSSANFGNLQGRDKSFLNSGRTFNQAEMNSLRQKNGFLRQAPPREAGADREAGAADGSEEAAEARRRGEDGLKMPYGQIRAPRRRAVEADGASSAGAETAAKTSAETEAAKTPADQAAKAADGARPEPASAEAGETSFTRDDLDRLVGRVAKALNIEPALIMAVIKTESNFNHQAVSRVGAKGLMQLMPGTAKDLGVEDPFNPVENVWGGARYLKMMLDRHGGSVDKALASYNWGPGNFDRYRRKGGQMPKETRNYIARVNRHYQSFKQDQA